MVAPLILKIVAFSLAKKIVVYLVARQYGFRRLYRRISKFNHSVNRECPILRTRMHNQLQFAFRLPGEVYKLCQRVQRWRGVPVPPSAPPAPSHCTTHSHPQQKQLYGYGFPRLYRRASGVNHYVNHGNPEMRIKMQNQLQSLFRLPSHVYQTVQRWGGVRGPPSAPPGSSIGTTHSHSQQKQVREMHTRSTALRVSSLNVPNASSSGFGFVRQSPPTHLLGRRGARNQISRFSRPFSSSLPPFGISSLVSPSKAMQASSEHFISPTGHGVLIKPDSRSDSVRTTSDIEHFFQSCGLLGASKHAFRSETMIDESRNSVRKRVGLSLVL